MKKIFNSAKALWLCRQHSTLKKNAYKAMLILKIKEKGIIKIKLGKHVCMRKGNMNKDGY